MTDEEWALTCTRHKAWARARKDYIDNGMNETLKWKRCVKSGSLNDMDDDCWISLIAAYPE